MIASFLITSSLLIQSALWLNICRSIGSRNNRAASAGNKANAKFRPRSRVLRRKDERNHRRPIETWTLIAEGTMATDAGRKARRARKCFAGSDHLEPAAHFAFDRGFLGKIPLPQR
jgi:hypothetical protein